MTPTPAPLGVARTFEIEIVAYHHDEARNVVQTLRDPDTGGYPVLRSTHPGRIELDATETLYEVSSDGRVWILAGPGKVVSTCIVNRLREQKGLRPFSPNDAGWTGYAETWRDDPDVYAVFERDPYYPCASFAHRYAAVWVAAIPPEVQFKRFKDYLYANVGTDPARRTDDYSPLPLPEDVRGSVSVVQVRATFNGLIVTCSNSDQFIGTLLVHNYAQYAQFARFVASCSRARMLDQISVAVADELAYLQERLAYELRETGCSVTVEFDGAVGAKQDFARAVIRHGTRITHFNGIRLGTPADLGLGDKFFADCVREVRRRFGLT